MKKIWIFLLTLPLFCFGDSEIDTINSAPILDQNPEYSAPPAVKAVPAEPAITHEPDIPAAPAITYAPGSRPAATANAPSDTPQAVPQENESIGKRQVYRRKPYPMGIKSLSNDQISDRTVFDPSAENAGNRRAASVGIRAPDNSDELARWKESQKNPARKFVPSDIFRPYSLLSSTSYSGSRSSNFRTGVRKKYLSSGTKRSSSCCGKVKISSSSCNSGTCAKTTVITCR